MLEADLLNFSWCADWCLNNPYETDVMMHAGLRARKPALCPPLTVEHRNSRPQFAKGRVKWNHQSYPRSALD